MSRALAGALALWMVVGIVLVSAHQAEAGHATLTDGTVVHVEETLVADLHAACQEHSATSTYDLHTAPSRDADPCWVGAVAQPGITSHPRFDRVVRAPVPETIAIIVTRPPAPSAVLHLAPKTSPPQA